MQRVPASAAASEASEASEASGASVPSAKIHFDSRTPTKIAFCFYPFSHPRGGGCDALEGGGGLLLHLENKQEQTLFKGLRHRQYDKDGRKMLREGSDHLRRAV